MHTSDNYGKAGMQGILDLAKQHGICIDVVKEVDYEKDINALSSSEFTEFLNGLVNQKSKTANESLGIIYFGQKNTIEKILLRLPSLSNNKYRGFQWIMSDFVGTSLEVFRDTKDIAEGALTISTSSVRINEVDEHYLSEWNHKHMNTSHTDGLHDLIDQFKTQLGADAATHVTYFRNDYITPIVDSVYVLATAVRDAFNAKCPGYKTICDGFKSYLEEQMASFIKNVRVDYSTMNRTHAPKELVDIGRVVEFEANGDLKADISTPLYDVNMYHYDETTEEGSFSKVKHQTKHTKS